MTLVKAMSDSLKDICADLRERLTYIAIDDGDDISVDPADLQRLLRWMDQVYYFIADDCNEMSSNRRKILLRRFTEPAEGKS